MRAYMLVGGWTDCQVGLAIRHGFCIKDLRHVGWVVSQMATRTALIAELVAEVEIVWGGCDLAGIDLAVVLRSWVTYLSRLSKGLPGIVAFEHKGKLGSIECFPPSTNPSFTPQHHNNED